MRNKDLFGVSKKNSVGPQDYDPNIMGRNTQVTVIKNPTINMSANNSVKKTMETYLGGIFEATDPNAKGRTHRKFEEPSTVAPKSLDQILPFAVDKRDVFYKSKIERDPLEPNKESKNKPGPGQYNPKLPKNAII